ncbi:MAG: hypothetical protein KAS32_02415 [Candidatus Peribacteraceae bacterium]|nr:hypothetical protein [Candidatus Peribacteraceae bacterium]
MKAKMREEHKEKFAKQPEYEQYTEGYFEIRELIEGVFETLDGKCWFYQHEIDLED